MKNFQLPDIQKKFSDWYNELVSAAKLADHSPVKGCITILPYGYSIWEAIQSILDKEIKKMNVENMAFPLLIPYGLIEKEKDHVAGFSPEIALVTHAGGEKLDEALAIRPTSEVIIHSYFKKWIHSWRDLPVKVNQWCSVIRWEKRPRPFIRTTEFWWQEGHTAHETLLEAKEQVMDAIKMYRDFVEKILCIPVYIGEKPPHERFAGAEETWTIEGMMQDGKAVQMGTSHLLSQSFSKSIGISFQNKEKQNMAPFLTSWGVTTRLIGTIIMVHGDQKGLILPPIIAPIQFLLVPIYKKNSLFKELILKKIIYFKEILSANNFKVKIDERDLTPGEKFAEGELKGIPFRIELGERDIEKNEFTLFIRDTLKKENVSINFTEDHKTFVSFFNHHFEEMQKRLYLKALQKREEKTVVSFKKLKEFGLKMQEKNGFFIAFWCGKEEDKFKIFGGSVRCILPSTKEELLQSSCCLHDFCEETLHKILVAKSY